MTKAALMATGHPYAGQVWPRVSAALDDYGARWSATHREACEVHLRGERSDALLDASMICLERRLGAFTQAIDVLAETR